MTLVPELRGTSPRPSTLQAGAVAGDPTPPLLGDRARALFGVEIHAVTMPEVLEVIGAWLRSSSSTCRYIVTPNVQHVVKLQELGELRDAYHHASLVVADGWPLVTASRWLGLPLPERVAGSDLVPNLCGLASSSAPMRLFLLGAAPGVGDRAKSIIEKRWPHVSVCGVLSPPLGFEADPAINSQIVTAVNACEPHLLVVGLGAPKQELWLRQHCSLLRAKVAVAAGATIDFLAGEQKRAPRWMRRLNLEWLHRLLSDPRRLAGRYFRDGLAFPKLFWREYRRRKLSKTENVADN